ncbi:Bug family tripartite tricarboxylate transporter substrate binding protein [Virgibacillus sp. W0181]|uniref:Bug family tripartite tricarboxylate transporter substrate binding protein n=1 Tax=Virgibacillus sp. W0181 TaxID=3391581 RepID=UPI003F47BA70
MKIKYLLSASLFALLLLLAACGSNSEDADASSNTDSQDENESSTEDYPSEDIDFLVGFSAGGGTDTVTRTAAQILNEEGIVEQNFVVENMPGAGGGLALNELKKRSDDPHVLLSMPDVGDPVWEGEIDADVTDYTLVAQLATDSIIVVVNSNSDYETFDDIVEAIKADPGSLDIGLGADVHSEEGHIWYQIAEQNGADFEEMNFIPHDGGAEITNSLLGEHIDVMAVNPSSIAGHIESGDLIPLAVASPERIEYYPDVPTLIESGVDHIYVRARGIWAGGDISDDVVKFWEEKFEELVNTETWQKEYLEKNLLVNDYKNSEEYEAYIMETAEKLLEFKEAVQ